MNVNNQLKEKFEITLIDRVQEIEERSWLMSSSIYYFNIALKDKEKKEYLFGVKNQNIYDKWVKNFRNAVKYRENTLYTKPVPPNEQLIQLLNDETNQITLHKRKIENHSINKKMVSILNLCPDDEQI